MLNGDEFRRNSTQNIYFKFIIMLELLSNEELDQVMGGVSAKEYCKTLGTIMANNDLEGGAADAARDSWNTHCA